MDRKKKSAVAVYKRRRVRYIGMYALVAAVAIGGASLYISRTFAAKKALDWPTASWQVTTPEQEGMRSETLAGMLDAMKADNVHSVLVARNGHIVLEAYNKDTAADTTQNVLSVTKSVTSALIGIALNEGKLQDVAMPIAPSFPEWTGDDARKQQITVKSLLTMTSGIAWSNEGEVSSKEMIASPDWTQYVLTRPMDADPGTKFMYTNGGPQVLSSLISRATGMDEEQYAAVKLFEPLGIKDFSWEKDPTQTPYGAFGLHLNTRDMAKFGLLYLQNGKWNGKTVVPKEWVAASTKQYVGEDRTDGSKRGYGYLWWLRNEKDGVNAADSSKYDMFSAVGSGGQRIVVVPKYDMVIVFTANNTDSFFADKYIDQYILPSVSGKKSLEPNPDGQKLLNEQISAFRTVGDTGPDASVTGMQTNP
ncbi:serine hydrolase domain-containing protein [Paenibacillus cymbidii]|uniref:serine hydrolase domain-containing protein n=1 Tax=Paenibacillus cymbidii TaxID=1639034 RepID=UPI001080F7D9|nr:serine hydrolase [Paenibacillus cymbidii]